jgi:hypothetical protein
MSAKDKERLIIAAGLVVVVAAALYLLVFRKHKAQEQAVATAPAAGESKAPVPGKGGGGFGPAGGIRLPGLAGGAAGAKAPVAGKGAFAAALAAALRGRGPAAPAVQPAEPYRADPFAPLIKPPPPPVYIQPPPPPAVQQVGIPPVMIQVLPLETMIVREQGQRRTAGVLWDHQVYAIIETEKTIAVVQPGDTVNGDTVRAISPQGLVLAVKGGEEVEVPLRSRPAGIAPAPSVALPQERPELPGPAAPY